MSDLFSKIFSKAAKVFHDVGDVVDADYKKLVSIFPGLATVAAAEASALKQQLSNAFAFVDTELAPKYADAVSMVESAADTLIMGMTKGVAGPALPLVNVGIGQGFAILHAVLDHAEAQAKAALHLPAPTSAAAPTVAGLVAAAAAPAAGVAAAVVAGH